jgi:16S rRNA processing protein RimM
MLLEVGKIDKAQGLRGEVVVTLTTNVSERLDPGSVLLAGPEPRRSLTVTSARPHQHRFVVAFAGVGSREQADELHGLVLYAEPFDDGDPDTLWIHELLGREVVELVDGAEQTRGRVVGVIDNPASDLLELDTGALVPLRFVTDHATPGRLVIDAPEGLFDDL